ncbi:MAG: hypothetical protein Q9225_007715 [Loekoesia sp. 1 TL-2023]
MWFPSTFIILSLYAIITVATATKVTSYTANFDDRTVVPSPLLNKVGLSKGLFYQVFDLSNKATGLSGVIPYSLPNAAGTTTTTNTLNATTPGLTVDYPNSKAISFDFYSFYFGCVVPTTVTGAVGVAVQCSILVAGFNAANTEIAVATFTFTPTAAKLVNAPMIQAKLPSSFVGLHNVTMVQSSPTTQVMLIDDLKYNVLSSS